jgi:hypothetical protein
LFLLVSAYIHLFIVPLMVHPRSPVVVKYVFVCFCLFLAYIFIYCSGLDGTLSCGCKICVCLFLLVSAYIFIYCLPIDGATSKSCGCKMCLFVSVSCLYIYLLFELMVHLKSCIVKYVFVCFLLVSAYIFIYCSDWMVQPLSCGCVCCLFLFVSALYGYLLFLIDGAIKSCGCKKNMFVCFCFCLYIYLLFWIDGAPQVLWL